MLIYSSEQGDLRFKQTFKERRKKRICDVMLSDGDFSLCLMPVSDGMSNGHCIHVCGGDSDSPEK